MKSMTHAVIITQWAEVESVSPSPRRPFCRFSPRVPVSKPFERSIDGFSISNCGRPNPQGWTKAFLNVASILGQQSCGPVAVPTVWAMDADMPSNQKMMPVRWVSIFKLLDETVRFKWAGVDAINRTASTGYCMLDAFHLDIFFHHV